MTQEKRFTYTYYTSPALERTQTAVIQACLRELWAVHHDDYAPESLKTHEAPAGGNRKTMFLIRELRERSVAEAQKEMNQLNFYRR